MLMPSLRVAIAGGTGMLGAPVARAFAKNGWDVRLLSRQDRPGPAHIRVDVTQSHTLAHAMDGCDALFISLRGATAAGMQAVEVEGVRALLAAAKHAGVQHVGYLSGAGIEAADPALVPVAVKRAAETAVREFGIAWTIFRATHFMESLPMFVRGRHAELFVPQPQAFRYIAAEDYANMVVRAFVSEGARNRAFLIAGPEPLKMAQALERYVQIVHPGMKIRRTPLALFRLIAWASHKPDLRHVAMLFDAFRRIPETGNAEEAYALLGRADTRLEDWCRRHRS